MPASDIWIEKLSFGHHRLHLIEKDPECVATMLKNGFSAVGDSIDEYVKDDYDDDQTLNYVITMADCYNQLMSNQGFLTAYVHLKSLKSISAKARKEARDSISKEELLVAFLSMQDLDDFLYTHAENNSKFLVDEASAHLDEGLAEFAQWLGSGSVIFRKDSKSTSDHFVIDRKRFGGDLCIKAYQGFALAKENQKAYEEWKDRFVNDECWVELFRSLLLKDESDDNTKYYYYYYYFSSNMATDELFEILNEKDPHYNTQTKRLIQKVLTTLSQEDVIFARELQRRYDEYRSIAGGRDITFDTTATTGTAQLTPQTSEPRGENVADIEPKESESKTKGKSRAPKYERFRLQGYLERDTMDIEGFKHCDGLRKRIINKGDKAFQKFIQGIAKKFHYIDDDPITKYSFAYALTGRGFQDKSIITKVKWHHKDKSKTKKGPRESLLVLLYISKHMFDSPSGKMYTQLFDALLNAETNPYKNPSKYADDVSEKFKEFFKSCFEDSKKEKVAKQ